MAIYKEENGKAPSYAKEGDIIVTGGGTYQLTNGAGNLIDPNTTTYNYAKAYDSSPSTAASSGTSSSGTTANSALGYYQTAANQSKNAVNTATQGAVSQLESQIPKVEQSYDDLAKQAYTNYMIGKRGLAEDLSEMGISTQGAAESTLNRDNLAYQNNLNSGEVARNQAVQDIYTQIAQAKSEGAANAANVQSQNSQNIASYLANLANTQLSQENSNAELQRQQTEAEKEYAYNQIALGYYTPELAAKAGLSTGAAEYISNLAKQQMTASKSTGGSAGSGSAKAYSLGNYAGQLLATWLENKSFDLDEALKQAYTSGLISQQDYQGALILGQQNGYNGQSGASQTSGIPQAKADMLNRWYETLDMVSPEAFANRVAQAIASGQLTQEEYAAWLNS